MHTFKLLHGFSEPEPLPEHYATWMWDDEVFNPDRLRGDIVTGRFNGIGDFLYNFPENSIVIVRSILGVNSGIVHDGPGNGWGFNVREDLLEITYYSEVTML